VLSNPEITQETLSFGDAPMTDMTSPSSYSGLYAYHKYWGKKPVEPLRALIAMLSVPGDIVVDPFLGSGAIAKEATDLGRRFLGSDINPIAVSLSEFNLNPCPQDVYRQALISLSADVKDEIVESYTVSEFGITSHLLWKDGVIESIWQRPPSGKRGRIERMPQERDYELASGFESYQPKILRPLKTFQNSRINSKVGMGWTELFSGRALRNIEILLHRIRQFPSPAREALELTLTASIGQMSRMVFAITSRGKASGTSTGKVEVGSWVIGFWRPQQHFEINVWNCFESRASKLVKALPVDVPAHTPIGQSCEDVLSGQCPIFIDELGAQSLLSSIPDSSVQIVITDPPHGDRIPYLELSEIWNGVLDRQANMNDEVVVSNAKGRGKSLDGYNESLGQILDRCGKTLMNGGFAVLLFNSRHQREWHALEALQKSPGMALLGAMPLNYSARSVVQDNREGAMKHDYIVIFGKGDVSAERLGAITSVPGWQPDLPTE
jgi:tRNA G10  N-methylase Trm11